MKQENKFRKFWVKSVNNWLCDADYNGKALKERSPTPSFRKYYFIKSWDDLKYFSKREGFDTTELVKKWLAENEAAAATPSPLPEAETGVSIDTPTEAEDWDLYPGNEAGAFDHLDAAPSPVEMLDKTPGNERQESGEGQTILSQYEMYIEYCDHMIGDNSMPMQFVQWREFNNLPHL